MSRRYEPANEAPTVADCMRAMGTRATPDRPPAHDALILWRPRPKGETTRQAGSGGSDGGAEGTYGQDVNWE